MCLVGKGAGFEYPQWVEEAWDLLWIKELGFTLGNRGKESGKDERESRKQKEGAELRMGEEGRGEQGDQRKASQEKTMTCRVSTWRKRNRGGGEGEGEHEKERREGGEEQGEGGGSKRDERRRE